MPVLELGRYLICYDRKRRNAVYEITWIKRKSLPDSVCSHHQLSVNADGDPRFAVFLFEQRLQLKVQDAINFLFYLNQAVVACLCAGMLQFFRVLILGWSYLLA